MITISVLLPDLVGTEPPQAFERVAPRFLSAGTAILDHACAEQGKNPEPVKMPSCVLGFVRSGCGEMRIGASSFLADCNRVVLFNPGTDYLVRHRDCRRRNCATTVHVDGDLVAEALESFEAPGVSPNRPFPHPVAPRSVELELLHYRLLAASRAGEDRLAVEELTMEAVEAALRIGNEWSARRGIDGGPGTGDGNRLVDRARGFLWSSHRERLDLSDVAQAIGCSRFHLCRTFKDRTGLTLTRYLHRIRITRALDRLLGGEEDLSRLALDLGYSTHSHFTSVFRRETGSTPSEMRSELTGTRAWQ